jgi:hypothetical protein
VTQASTDVDRQRKLIVLDRENVVTASVDDRLAQVTLAEDRIAGDNASLHRHNAQQLQGRLVFVGLGIDPELRQHRAGRNGVGGNQVLAGHGAVAAAAQAFAIQGEDGHFFLRQAGGDPACQGGFKGDDIESPEEDGVGGFGGRFAPTEAKDLGQGEALIAAELGNRLVGFAAAEHGDDGQAENGRERMADALATSGVGDIRQDFEQGKRGRHGKPPASVWASPPYH